MYKNQDELIAAIYSMAAPGGTIFRMSPTSFMSEASLLDRSVLVCGSFHGSRAASRGK